MLRKSLILVTLLLSLFLLAFGTDLGSSFGAFFQSISPRPGANTATYSLSGGLVGHWTFDGKDTAWNTNTTQDKSGSGNTGTMTSMSTTTSPVPGKLGQGFNFDGVNDYVDIDPVANDLQSGNFSVSLWFKPASTFDSAKTVDQRLFTVADAPSNNDIKMVLAQSDGSLAFEHFDSGGASRILNSTQTSWSAGTWYHVTGTFEGGVVKKLYINGIENASTVSNLTRGSTFSLEGAIGAVSDGTLPFNGTIDDVRSYNRALSADEVKQLYLMGSSLKQNITPRKGSSPPSYTLESGLVGHWTFDGKDTAWNSNTTQDKSGQGNTGTMTSMSTTTSPVPGKLGQGFKFDGVDDYMNVTDHDSLDLTSGGAISLWAKWNGKASTYQFIVSKKDGANDFTQTDGYMFYGSDFNGGTVDITGPGQAVSPFAYYTRYLIAVDTSWHNWVAVYSGTTHTLYKDGVVQTPASINGTPASLTAGTQNLLIGKRTYTGELPVEGNIDDVRIYNRALSADEVKQLYLQGSSLKQNITPRKGSNTPTYTLEGGSDAHWTFDGKDTSWHSNTTQDKSGSGLTGRMTLMSTTTSPVPGKLGQGFNFDGVDDYVNMGGVNADSRPGRTACAWVKPSAFPNDLAAIFRLTSVIGLRYDTSGQYKDRAYNSAGTESSEFIFSNTALSTRIWSSVCAVHFYNTTTSTIFVRYYINGNLDKETDTALTDGNGLIGSSATQQMRIGSDPDSAGRLWNGAIDDVRIYNRALSADEVKQLYLMGR